jgi:hypothetical protein
MVSGQYGLGYVINTSYTMVRYPTIVIGMITLGAVGYVTSALVRVVGDYLMQWRTRELALGGPMMATAAGGAWLPLFRPPDDARGDRDRRRRQDLRSGRRRGDGRRPLLAQHRSGRDLHDRRPVGCGKTTLLNAIAGLPRNHVGTDSARRRGAVQRGETEGRARRRIESSSSRTARSFRGRPTSRTSPSAR